MEEVGPETMLNPQKRGRHRLPHLRELWLQSTSASILDKFLGKTKVVELCCLEIVNWIRLKGQRLNPLNH